MPKVKRTKVRFHLGAGENFMKWRIEYPNGDVRFVDPNKEYMVLHDCQLHNRKGTAKRINEGGEKVVCAWIWCDWVQMVGLTDKGTSISYNPRIQPNWVSEGLNVDNHKYERIQTIGNKLIALN